MAKAEDTRECAHRIAAQGVGIIASAINACDNPAIPYKFDVHSRRRFLAIVGELHELIDSGRILPNKIGVARADPEFQDFLRNVTSPGRNPAAGSFHARWRIER